MHKNITNQQFDANSAVARANVTVDGAKYGFDVACARFIGSLRRLVSMLGLRSWHHQTISRFECGNALQSGRCERESLIVSEYGQVAVKRYSNKPNAGLCQIQALMCLKPASAPVPSLVTI